ncbi:hypothetical protein BKA69DRAFT_1121463 [Paraphysoderma sedebokerense]|nr:hypothetical protein BKA69DRAFT_1121463 [Paraphysoderma sedebokerense]
MPSLLPWRGVKSCTHSWVQQTFFPKQYTPPDRLDGKVIVVTGANSGIGYFTALALAKAGGTVILACRSEEKTAPALKSIKEATGNESLFFLKLDLSSFTSIKDFVRGFNSKFDRLDILINNAGLLSSVHRLTEDGFEIHFATNHLGPYLLVRELMPTLLKSQPSRIVNVASTAHTLAPKCIDFENLRSKGKSKDGFTEYARSKLCNVLFTRSLAQKLEGTEVSTFCLHPGVIASDIWRYYRPFIQRAIKKFMITEEQGACTTIYCATCPGLEKDTGNYFDNCAKSKYLNPVVFDDELVEKLWNLSAEWTGQPAKLTETENTTSNKNIMSTVKIGEA